MVVLFHKDVPDEINDEGGIAFLHLPWEICGYAWGSVQSLSATRKHKNNPHKQHYTYVVGTKRAIS